MSNLYLIRNVGCDDETVGLVYMTDEQLYFFKNVIENLNRNSECACMPTVHVYRIDKNVLREATDKDCIEPTAYLDGVEYVFEDYYEMIFNDRLEKVI